MDFNFAVVINHIMISCYMAFIMRLVLIVNRN